MCASIVPPPPTLLIGLKDLWNVPRACEWSRGGPRWEVRCTLRKVVANCEICERGWYKIIPEGKGVHRSQHYATPDKNRQCDGPVTFALVRG